MMSLIKLNPLRWSSRLFFSFLIYISAMMVGHGQNLLSNGGFEKFESCPDGEEQQLPNGWSTANNASPDYYNRCSQSKRSSVPENWAGVAEPRSGDGYIGLYLMKMDEDYREYIRTELSTYLIPQMTYIIEFYVRLSSYSSVSVNTIGCVLTQRPLNKDTVGRMNIKTALLHKTEAPYAFLGDWRKVSFEYVAYGGEKHLTIGNFNPLAKLPFRILSEREGFTEELNVASYAYIDDVTVKIKKNDGNKLTYTPLKDVPRDSTEFEKTRAAAHRLAKLEGHKYETDSVYTFSDLRFEFNSATLETENLWELEWLAGYLSKNDSLSVRITGHTDNIGSDLYNKSLSLKRASSVKQFLTEKGVAPRSVAILGYGEEMPIESNDTESGRSANRRVTFELTRKPQQ